MSERVNVDWVDLYVDLTFGALLVVGLVAMIVFGQHLAAVTFGGGVFVSYAVHIGWRMARFDPDTVDRIEQAVDEQVGEKVDEMTDDVEEKVEEKVDEATDEIESTVEDAIEDTD